MDKKSAFQVLDSANEELQGKMKNLVWCDAEQKVLSIAVPESYEFPRRMPPVAVSRKNGFPTFPSLPAAQEKNFLCRPIKQTRNLKII